MSERHSRQVRLVEIGPAGQRRIASSVHVVRGGGLAANVEARYLAGAGVKAIEVDHEGIAATAREVDGGVEIRFREDDRAFEHDPPWATELALPARDVALGAYRALRALRRVVLRANEPTP